MYRAFRDLCERVLRIPPEPEPPPGDEAQTRLFRAAPNYYRYLLVLWAVNTTAIFLAVVIGFGAPLAGVLSSRQKWGAAVLAILFGLALVLTLVLRLISLAIVALNFEKRWYLVTDRSLRVREGIVTVREATVTFANI
jgi:hypothetical protein